MTFYSLDLFIKLFDLTPPDSTRIFVHLDCTYDFDLHFLIRYVAQHAFHHIEQHLDKTPNEYIRWRYETGDDKEALNKVTCVISEEELLLQRSSFEVSWKDEVTEKTIKEKRVIEKIVSRKTEKKKYAYEVKWVDKMQGQNSWYERKTEGDQDESRTKTGGEEMHSMRHLLKRRWGDC